VPGFNVTEISVLNQIKSNLQDRYETGFPILKELLQNADDSGAETICCDFLPGWPTAINPLLRGAGLLVINDGEFRAEDQRGITSFGESGKTTDTAAIGKFGFGQKSVFHLCDAFVISPEGTQAKASSVVNPFLGVDVLGNVSGAWEALTESDLALLSRSADGAGFGKRRLILWLPFRRRDLAPAPDAGFSNEMPNGAVLLGQFRQLEALRATLACLRQLRRVELRSEGRIELSLSVASAADRLLGPKAWAEGVREFAGRIELMPRSAGGSARFIGRESMVGSQVLNDLRSSNDWPKTISVLHPTPQPEKGEPHGAATLVHSTDDQRSDLRIQWAVFLPTSDETEIKIDLAPGQGRFTLLLHGYFFLDSGRRRIEAIDEVGDPAQERQLRQRWNIELRDQVTLPLIPRLLEDALGAKVLDSGQLATLVGALRTSEWFADHQSAICKTDQLLRILDASGNIAWRALPAGAKVRPLPKSVLDAPLRLAELFPLIHDWAQAHDIALCVDPAATLSAGAMEWNAEELGDLIPALSSKAFVSRPATDLLADFLKMAAPSLTTRQVIGPALAAGLRRAFCGQPPLASSESIRAVLAHVPSLLIFALPAAVEHRAVLRSMAEVDADVLAVRSEHVEGERQNPRLNDQTVERLLTALEPLVDDDDHSDQAASAALAILAFAHNSVRQLAEREDLARLKILKARGVRTREVVTVSLHDLLDRSRRGLLFGQSPQNATFLPKLVNAVLDADPLVIEGNTMSVLQDMKSGDLRLAFASRDTILPIVRSAVRFGEADARGALLDQLRPTDGDDPKGFRMLCAGNPDAALPGAKLYQLEGLPAAIEDLVVDLLARIGSGFVVPDAVIHRLNRGQKSLLSIGVYDAATLERDLVSDLDRFGRLMPSEGAREALLLVIANAATLAKLPIHARSDGSVGPIDATVFRVADWKIPPALASLVLTLKPASDLEARRKQAELTPAWSPAAQLRVALGQPGPQDFWQTILDAVGEIGRQNPDDPVLAEARSVAWLTVGGKCAPAGDILVLPTRVDQEARRALAKSGADAAFYTRSELDLPIRDHPGFRVLQDHVLPDRATSMSYLAMMIAEAGLVGRVAGNSEQVAKDLRRLAGADLDLCLPGSALLGAILTVEDLSDTLEAEVIAAFAPATDPAHVGQHLDALARAAGPGGAVSEAARRLYKAGFAVVASRPDAHREAVFAGTAVPTQAGVWRTGSEVAGSGAGIAPGHLLSADFAAILTSAGDDQGPPPSGVSMAAPERTDGAFDTSDCDLAALEHRWAEQHSRYLETWRGRVPGELPIVYLGLIGRHTAIEAVANAWAGEATASVETIWAGLDQALDPTLPSGIGLRDEVNDRRFEIVLVNDDVVVARALSGAEFTAPLALTSDNLVIGNLHQRAKLLVAKDGHKISRITLSLRPLPESGLDHEKAKSSLSRLIEIVGEDCLQLIMSSQRSALSDVLDKGNRVDQATLEETQLELMDRLPSILPQLKLPVDSKAHKVLRAYLEDESQTNRLQAAVGNRADKLSSLKQRLWDELTDAVICQELLTAIRAKIGDLGYSPERVLFELFQNADDAYGQLDHEVDAASFRVESLASPYGGFRTVHWGRTINHLGRDVETARDLGHARDLLNMLVMSFSDKRANEDLTGKFGLGFKSVHVLSDDVGVASGFISLRIRGGLLPDSWTEGLGEVEARRSPQAQKATLVDVPFTPETAPDGRLALAAFRSAAPWMPAFSHHIRHIQIDDGEPLTAEGSITPLLRSSTLQVIDLRGTRRQRALRIDLGDHFHLFLGLDEAGPTPLPDTLKRLWNLAPLEEEVGSGWILNGPFAVDPGRGRLSGTIEGREERFRSLGQALGRQLTNLFDLSSSDWPAFATALELDGSPAAQAKFWIRLEALFRGDVQDRIAVLLHEGGGGYAGLAAERPVTPTGLPSPFPTLIQAKDVDHHLAGALSEPGILGVVSSWPQTALFHARVVSKDTAGSLESLGLGGGAPLTLADVIAGELAADPHLDLDVASRFGAVISPDTIDAAPLLWERTELFTALRAALFRAGDDTWRPAQGLTVADSEAGEEQLIARFAPASAVLHASYAGAALGLFRVARRESGYGPRAAQLADWAMAADTAERRQAALRYVIDGNQGRLFALELRSKPLAWLPLDRLADNPLLAAWSLEDQNRLKAELLGYNQLNFNVSPWTSPAPSAPDAGRLFNEVGRWWLTERDGLTLNYQRRLYPAGFSLTQLHTADDRQAWFTMFALACFQTLGRTMEGQHRAFIEGGMRDGWWLELANSKPPHDAQAWLDRLERWSGPLLPDQQFLSWRRVFVDLYTFARWLDDYIIIMRKLPRVVEHHGPISLQDILKPGFSPALAALSIDAAPIHRSLGIGINWLVRELVRCGLYGGDDVARMAPYSFASSERVRDGLLGPLGHHTTDGADADESRRIHDFIQGVAGSEVVRFGGDYDLPLQLITRREHQDALLGCFEAAGGVPDELDSFLADDDDDAEQDL
jgi:hypothetical protein